MRQREERLREQRQKQVELINELKAQLEDLERYAYETGDAGLPQSLLLERQKLVIGECVLNQIAVGLFLRKT